MLVRATVATLAASGLAIAAPALTAPVEAARVVYGYAWADGTGHLRIVPKSPAKVTRQRHVLYKLAALSGAKEVRLGYTGAAYRRVTVACALKETEGQVATDADGLGRTPCKASDLTDSLGRGAVPARIEYQDGQAVKVSELLIADWPDPRSARGTIKRINDTTVLFATGGKKIKLGYTYSTSFHRTTARCRDGWLAGEPVNADRNGLGTKHCVSTDLSRALRTTRYPVLVKVDYTPGMDALNEVWEVYGDA
ncbi:hypothetical protein [Nonomuraea zeae]|uniref:Uncharacterized protein n=1 Tax=Nonomuraea zeae TaxID=1642303 RepID=A0A5S4G4H7_9ACTN|nr:hypothetical protein [Nonomuraea zeae]TMR27414.1 hypothetical protein ETD85_39280 [Nonomuraea zeae]